MRLSEIRLGTDDHGNLCVKLSRGTYAALAVVLALAAALMHSGVGAAIARESQAPVWAWRTAMAVFVAFALAFGAQALWGRALAFDARRAAIVRGSRVVAPFAHVSHVELVERRLEHRSRYWALHVQLLGGRRIFIGRDSSDADASVAAARVATAVGRAVKHLVR